MFKSFKVLGFASYSSSSMYSWLISCSLLRKHFAIAILHVSTSGDFLKKSFLSTSNVRIFIALVGLSFGLFFGSFKLLIIFSSSKVEFRSVLYLLISPMQILYALSSSYVLAILLVKVAASLSGGNIS